MADRHFMRAGTHTPSGQSLSLDDAIKRLESGVEPADLENLLVDIGDGRIARADGVRGASGLLQRLRGHRMLMALASDAENVPRLPVSDQVSVSPEVQEILDAATTKR